MNIERLQEIVEEVKLLPDDAGEERLDGFAQVELYFRFMYAVPNMCGAAVRIGTTEACIEAAAGRHSA